MEGAKIIKNGKGIGQNSRFVTSVIQYCDRTTRYVEYAVSAYLRHLWFLCRLRHSCGAITHIYLRYRTIKGITTILFICNLELCLGWSDQGTANP